MMAECHHSPPSTLINLSLPRVSFYIMFISMFFIFILLLFVFMFLIFIL